jgi:type IV fimbrial biogenesis protein FimT
MSRPHPPRGFTLVEFLVTLAILSVLAATAVPALAGFGQRLEMRRLSGDLLGNLYLARSEAIKRNGRVVLCKSADASSCASSGGWEQGWIVFHDSNNDGLRAPGETLLQAMPPLPSGWRLAGNASVARHISFDPTGGTRLASGAFQAGTLTLCRLSLAPTPARQLVINANGRPRVQDAAVDSCP